MLANSTPELLLLPRSIRTVSSSAGAELVLEVVESIDVPEREASSIFINLTFVLDFLSSFPGVVGDFSMDEIS